VNQDDPTAGASDADILHAYWPLQVGSLRSLKTLGNGRRILFAESPGGPVVAKLFRCDRPLAETTADVAAIRRAAEHGITRDIIATYDGSLLAAGAWGSGYLTPFVAGVHPPATTQRLRDLGDLLGRLHTTPAPDPRLRWHDAQRVAEIRERCAHDDAPAWFQSAALILGPLPDCPLGFIHTDAFFNNCLQQADGTLVLIDWDDAGTGPFVTDLAYVCACLSWNSPDCGDLITAFASGYRPHRRVTAQEIACLPRSMLFWMLLYADFARPDAGLLCQRILDHGEAWASLLS
jgi:Ser/Thr protein kinase RdoA (MazF antagonist)